MTFSKFPQFLLVFIVLTICYMKENAAMIFGKPQAAKSSDSSRGYGNDDDDDSESSEEIEATMTTTKNVVPSSTIPRQDVVDNRRCLLQKDPNFMVISGAAGGVGVGGYHLRWAWDGVNKRCESFFVMRGGNADFFLSKNECENACESVTV